MTDRSTSGPMASASPASVITLMVWPWAYRHIKAAKIDWGMFNTAIVF
jgi:hypothetical protein